MPAAAAAALLLFVMPTENTPFDRERDGAAKNRKQHLTFDDAHSAETGEISSATSDMVYEIVAYHVA